MASPFPALLHTQSDERLVALARAGHERAFEVIVERYRRPLLRHCGRMVSDARAEDVLQQALLAAWSAMRRGDEVRELSPWLHKIVFNTALNAKRGPAGQPMEELQDYMRLTDAPHEVLERQVAAHQTLANIAALPERQRVALLRTALGDDSQEIIARDLGLSHGAVRQLVHRARLSLRAAATAITPPPLAAWLAGTGARAEPLLSRLPDLAAGVGTAGVGGALAKAGVVVVIAGGAAAGPTIVKKVEERGQAAEAQAARAALRPAPGRVQEGPGGAALRVERGAARTPSAAAGADGSRGSSASEGAGRAAGEKDFDLSEAGQPQPGDSVSFDDAGRAAPGSPAAEDGPPLGAIDDAGRTPVRVVDVRAPERSADSALPPARTPSAGGDEGASEPAGRTPAPVLAPKAPQPAGGGQDVPTPSAPVTKPKVPQTGSGADTGGKVTTPAAGPGAAAPDAPAAPKTPATTQAPTAPTSPRSGSAGPGTSETPGLGSSSMEAPNGPSPTGAVTPPAAGGDGATTPTSGATVPSGGGSSGGSSSGGSSSSGGGFSGGGSSGGSSSGGGTSSGATNAGNTSGGITSRSFGSEHRAPTSGSRGSAASAAETARPVETPGS